ncbi:hypothetical protein EJ03DRAFT_194020 [Teratosphaeria nubilosa]|uniref:Secreted protein n=1 Tax=Teratosphaeria nubilosa TaxID=161662 RepID=A0A6G1KZF4_9PEZI|nr:hypothetical protein EJ03DRAFT_194020 [Teratosphaeria nubilosa]
MRHATAMVLLLLRPSNTSTTFTATATAIIITSSMTSKHPYTKASLLFTITTTISQPFFHVVLISFSFATYPRQR